MSRRGALILLGAVVMSASGCMSFGPSAIITAANRQEQMVQAEQFAQTYGIPGEAVRGDIVLVGHNVFDVQPGVATPPNHPFELQVAHDQVATVGEDGQTDSAGKKDEENGKEDNDNDDECKECEPPEAIFEWAIGHKQDEENGDSETDPYGFNNNFGGEEPEEEDTITTDRPDFTEASKTVGRGRIQFEMGYLYIHDDEGGTTKNAHAYPNLLVRIGMFTEWFELRIGQTFTNERTRMGGVVTRSDGAQDTYLGFRVDLTEQKGWLPETSLISQMFLPTGVNEFTSDSVMPGVALMYSWEVIPDCISVGGSTIGNRARDDSKEFYIEFAQSFTVAYTLTKKLGAYTEWFAFFPNGAIDPGVGPEHYFNGGFTYLLYNNLQLDIEAGVGLNEHADDFFFGTGLAVRF